jgi:hypothetical protein
MKILVNKLQDGLKKRKNATENVVGSPEELGNLLKTSYP